MVAPPVVLVLPPHTAVRGGAWCTVLPQVLVASQQEQQEAKRGSAQSKLFGAAARVEQAKRSKLASVFVVVFSVRVLVTILMHVVLIIRSCKTSY